ncbi:MAG: ABC transporter ATP-binding protein [Candidatus Dadabacteria bacterium]|jgi:phospholipid/cholesterol/gamma-HCH transport system ATP-binding protein|nr:ABC transporter ATP-binding protein [Candidatus Dadabacteria bacterium]MCZ6685892.1 ABC transporter ATP-binding protein [Candidatus Dadabacteria bacterium]MCZ6865165.1 ABC transporter ATP-binding protein [Candidatus Dadabacteria bacterium]
MPEEIIGIKNVYKAFDSKEVHTGVTLSIKKGENITVLGGSGSGKSVLLKEITGLLKPDSGDVIIEGQNIVPMDERELVNVRKNIGMLFQGSALFDSLTVEENIAYPLRENASFLENEIKEIVAKNLELVGLPDIEDKMPSDLSGGMKKRVGLARAMAMNPKILLYDEPTTGLDPPNITRINQLIRDMQAQFGITGVIITHDVQSAFEISDRVAFLYHGKIVFTGTVEEAKNTDVEILSDFINAKMEGGDE